MKIQQQLQPRTLHPHGQRQSVCEVVGVVVRISLRLRCAAGEQSQPHAIEAVVFQDCNGVARHATRLVADAAILKERQMRKVRAAQEFLRRGRRREKQHNGETTKYTNYTNTNAGRLTTAHTKK